MKGDGRKRARRDLRLARRIVLDQLVEFEVQGTIEGEVVVLRRVPDDDPRRTQSGVRFASES
jgi:predicted RNA-binding protein with PUA domain